MRNKIRNISLCCVICGLITSTFAGCNVFSEKKTTTEIIAIALDENDYSTIIKYSPEYIYNKTVEEKEQEYLTGGFDRYSEFVHHNDTIIWMYLLSLLKNTDELLGKSTFVDEFIKCEKYFLQKSPDCYFHITYVYDLFVETPEELKRVAEALSMAMIKSENVLDIVPAVASGHTLGVNA